MGKRAGRNRYNIALEPITTKAGLILEIGALGIFMSESRHENDWGAKVTDITFEKDGKKAVVGRFMAGEKRDWHGLMLDVLKEFDIKDHPYSSEINFK